MNAHTSNSCILGPFPGFNITNHPRGPFPAFNVACSNTFIVYVHSSTYRISCSLQDTPFQFRDHSGYKFWLEIDRLHFHLRWLQENMRQSSIILWPHLYYGGLAPIVIWAVPVFLVDIQSLLPYSTIWACYETKASSFSLLSFARSTWSWPLTFNLWPLVRGRVHRGLISSIELGDDSSA